MNGTRVCSVEGCDRPHVRYGWCSPHSQRWAKHGDVMAEVPIREKVYRYADALCSIEGCEKAARRRGWCSMHYARHRVQGDVGDPATSRRRDDPTGAKRLATGVVQDGDCIRWAGAHTPTGYGHMSIEGRAVPVHRVSYELEIGPIPAGLEIDHLCRTRDCVNPEHLEAVTHQENIRRIPVEARSRKKGTT